MNNWYRDWANDRGIAHLILTEAKPALILGMIVLPDSADPGLANVRPVSIGADHIGICKPADHTQEIYVLVRDFIMQPVQHAKPLADAVVAKLLDALDARGVTVRAEEARIERRTILELAQRLKPHEVLDLDQAVKELTAAVGIAIEVSEKGARGSNLGDLVDAVLAGMAAKTRTGDIEGAAREADRGFAEWERAEAERHALSVHSGIALLEAGLRQDILRRDALAAARRVQRIATLEHPDDASARFEMMRERRDAFYARGRDKGVNFDLLVAIEIARLALGSAQDAQQRGTALNNLGNALAALGERESGTARLEEAVTAYRDALKERTRERVPLQWAMTQSNLGNALAALGERESGTARLEEAVTAYRDALEEWTRERVPLDWAMTQNLGAALNRLGERESGTARLDEAVTAYRDALKEVNRERVPLDWASTQSNLGYALQALGERESDTARLEEAVTAYRDALKERTRERVPLRWAASLGNEGVVLMLLAERREDVAMAETALSQITTAFETVRDGGDARSAEYYESQLPKARIVVARLRGR